MYDLMGVDLTLATFPPACRRVLEDVAGLGGAKIDPMLPVLAAASVPLASRAILEGMRMPVELYEYLSVVAFQHPHDVVESGYAPLVQCSCPCSCR